MRHIRQLTETGLLAALITITGAIKLPGLFPGTEFQLSAPLAVAICGVFGFRQYIIAGVISSLLGLALGTQNGLAVLVAMVFRLTAGGVLYLGGSSWPVVAIAGPVASAAARMVVGLVVNVSPWPLLVAALPGMAYTAAASWPLTLILRKIKNQSTKVMIHVIQR
ncbi:biotin biosynthesis biox [Lucifera butyrica]|uniref:Biotin biosynthesis biox n=1 Tax=Lucifera butyrica TaxID=1351585 RepID=A0A498R945_9FIRM|nr:hypothetical protein [Lucifera butyrica]VBB07450.1 biotin biosynthesis biox [Lucifera butyrica]